MALVLVTPLVTMPLLTCKKKNQPATNVEPPPANTKPVHFVEDEALSGLRMRLFEAGAPSMATEAVPPAEAEILSADRTAKLLARVDELQAEGADRTAFAVRQGSLPPPLTGETVDIPFPPPEAPPIPDEGEPGTLEVLRFAPEGEVPMAPHLSLTFSRPMVSVTSQEEAAQTVPVQLSPTPAGGWRWLGTRTALFDPDPRFPMATEYTVTVPAGTSSATGDALADGLSFTFLTPALGLAQRHPEYGPHGLEPVIFLGFDQAIDVDALLPFVNLKGGGQTWALRRATDEEIAADPSVKILAERAEDDRWIALRPKNVLPRATNFTVTVREGAPSAEGPRTTPGDQAFSFRTFDPLRIVDHHCNWYDECPPTSGWRIEFNNPLDEEAFDPSKFRVDPEVPGMRVQVWGNDVTLDGIKQGRTVYTVTVPASLKDAFGQTFGQDDSVKFKVGPAEKTLFGPPQEMVVLDPVGPKQLSVYSTNHDKLKVRIHRVGAEQWNEWMSWMRTYNYDDRNPGPLPGTEVLAKTIKVEGESDTLVETPIDLSPHLQDGFGQFLVRVEPTKQPKERWYRQEVLVWVQVTQMGLTAFADNDELVAWATTLADGAPMNGVELQVLPGGQPASTSDDAGLARLQLLDNPDGPQVLVASHGADVALLPQQVSWWNEYAGWRKVEVNDQLRWYTFDDRGLYKPNEEVRVKGWLRVFETEVGGDIQGLDGQPGKVSWTLRGPRGNDLASGTETLSALGGFDLSMTLPDNVNLGTAWLQLEAVDAGSLGSTSHTHSIQIQEFRRPEFEVSATVDPGPYVLGHEATFTAEAAYYAGGGLPAAPVYWSVHSSPGSYTPPNRSDYTFGVWSPWWWYGSRTGDPQSHWESLEGKTDGAGRHYLGVHFEAMNPPRPTTVTAEATITDVNRQAWTATSTVLVHPSSLYVGLRSDATFVGKGDKVEVDAIAVDIDGAAVPGTAITMTMALLDWTYKGGSWTEIEVDPQTCELVSGAEAGTCTFEPEEGGSYRIKATVADGNDRPNESELRVWVAGGERPPARQVEQEQITLIPENETVEPGQTARLLIQAPFAPAEGVMTVRRSGLVHTERFRMEEATHTLEVAVLDEHVPDLTVQVDLVGAAVRSNDEGEPQPNLPRRVAFATGSLTFEVPPLKRTLEVAVSPRLPKLEPGSETAIELVVTDADGQPVQGAEVALVVADESVLALTGYQLPNPIDVFYAARGSGVSDYHTRHHVVLSDPLAVAAAAAAMNAPAGGAMAQTAMPMSNADFGAMPPAPMEGAARMAEMDDDFDAVADEAPLRRSRKKSASKGKGGGGEDAPIAMRTDFRALALFAPEVSTDAQGKASVDLTLPDSLTRYRVMAVAVSRDNHFGSGESSITARLPLMTRPSPPRFLNFGDRFELPVVLQNQTDEEMTVELALRATNVTLAETLEAAQPGEGTGLPVSAGRKVSIPANDRVEVRFPAAAQMAGTARFQVAASTGSFADAASFELPVWTPATSEAFATYGVIDDGVMVQPVRAPGEVWPQFGGLEITTSSTQLQALTDAVLYLVQYPFECQEQISSRVLAIAALRDVLSAFEAEELPSPEELEAVVAADLERLKVRQNHDGGWSFWRKGDRSWPYLTVHVAHALTRAQEKGYEVDAGVLQDARKYLARIERHIPHWYSEESKRFIRAYAVYVLHRMDHTDVNEARKLIREAGGIEEMPLEALGWLLPTLQTKGDSQVDAILRHLSNRVTETAAGAHFVTSYSDGAHVLLHSDRRADGILLEALIGVDTDNDVIPKLVAGLLDHRKRGKWSNTQENCFVLLALDRYFHVYEGTTPDFVARAWLGDTFAGQHEFRGRTTERAHIDVPMGYLTETPGDQNLILQKDGAGRMYYRVGMRYAPRDLDLDPADYGFAVERVYEAVDDDGDVSRDEDGTWRIVAGARVRIRLTMVAPMRRYHVALVDPLPAGLEPMNPDLAVTGSLPEDPSASNSGRYWWWWRTWYEHENLRDERVEAFTSLLWAGVHEYTYVARATTPGEFVVPPTKAEEMYHPETFGRTGTDRVIVE